MSEPTSIFGGLAKDDTLRADMTLHDHLQLEGVPWYAYATANNVTATDNLVIGGGLTLPGLTKAVWIESAMMSSNKLLDLQFTLGSGNRGQSIHRAILNPGVPAVIPIRQLVRPSMPASSNGFGDFRIRTVIDSTPTGAHIMGSVAGTAVYDDFNYAADKVILFIGDSILNGTSGITDKIYSMDWLTREYFQQNGVNVRAINRSYSGSTSGDHERYRAHGNLEFPQVDYIHYQLGVNDAGQAIPTVTFKNNVKSMIDYKKSRYPAAQMIVWGPTPLQNNTKEAALIAMRSAASDAVNEANDPTIHFASLASAFDRTNESNYASSDPSGDKTHPNNTSHVASFGLIKNVLDDLNMSTVI